MRRPLLLLFPFLLSGLALVHCGGEDAPLTPAPADGGAEAAVDAGDAGASATNDPPLVPASKVDLLLVVDNSAGMAAKQQGLAEGVGKLLSNLPVSDIHVGVISTSLGSGGNVCQTSSNPRNDDRGHLLNKNAGGTVVAGAESGFLTLGPGGDRSVLEARTKELILGVGQSGCGLEAQLESMYRFVSEPEPPLAVTLDDLKQAGLSGIDYELLKQRKSFFRPDSLVAIVMVTDEDDGSIDPRSVGGFGYAFASRDFPGSSVHRGSLAQGTTAPRGTSACATDPLGPDCTSCGFATNCDPATPECQRIKSDANCLASPVPGTVGIGYDGFYGPTEDAFGIRMFDMRRRFGVEPRYPVTRYRIALTGRLVPSRVTEHVEAGQPPGQRIIGDYQQTEACTNPLFARDLPEKEGDPLCKLADSGRSSRLVYFGLIGGAPADLVKAPVDFTKLVGAKPPADGSVSNDPALDPRMIESPTPRAGVASDWDTKRQELQYACTFPLSTPVVCSGGDPCDCAPGLENPSPILCGGPSKTTVVNGKANPSFRELLLAQQLGDRALVASACELDGAGSYGAFAVAFAEKVRGSIAK